MWNNQILLLNSSVRSFLEYVDTFNILLLLLYNNPDLTFFLSIGGCIVSLHDCMIREARQDTFRFSDFEVYPLKILSIVTVFFKDTGLVRCISLKSVGTYCESLAAPEFPAVDAFSSVILERRRHIQKL